MSEDETPLFEDEDKFLFDEDDVMENTEAPSNSTAVKIEAEEESFNADEDMMAFNQAIAEEIVLEAVSDKPSESAKPVEKKKFQVKVPTKRRNLALPESIGDHITAKKETQERGKKRLWQPQAMTASGPFAMGPAKASGFSQPATGSSGSKGSRQMTVMATSLKAAGRDASSSSDGNKSAKQSDVDSTMDDASPRLTEIPFVEVGDEDDDQSVEEEMIIDDTPAAFKPQRLGVKVVTHAEETSQQKQLHFIQFPKVLPLVEQDAKHRIDEVEGKIGQLIQYKSGKMKLKIGGILYDMTPAELSKTYIQSIACINSDDRKLHFLGDLDSKHICTPDLSSL